MFESILKEIALQTSIAVDRVHDRLEKYSYEFYASRRGIGHFPSDVLQTDGMETQHPTFGGKADMFRRFMFESTEQQRINLLVSNKVDETVAKYLFCCRRVQHNLTIYTNLFTLFGFKICPSRDEAETKKVKLHLKTIFMLWLSLDIQDKLENYLKFHTAYLFSLSQDQEEKPVSNWPQPGIFMTGPFSRFVRNKRLRSQSEISFFWSLLQAKKGCQPLKVKNVAESCLKHAALMTRVEQTPKDILDCISQVGSEVGRLTHREGKIYNFNVPAPSTRACYEAGIAKGGARSYIHKNLRKIVPDDEWSTSEDAIMIKLSAIDSDTQDKEEEVKGQIDPEIQNYIDFHKEEYGFEPSMDMVLDFIETQLTDKSASADSSLYEGANSIVSDEPDSPVDSIETIVIDVFRNSPEPAEIFEAIEKTLIDAKLPDPENAEIIDYQFTEPLCRAKVVALPEPFKTRIITKSEAYLNYYGKPLQKAMHSVIKKQKWGFAIGRPIVVKDVQERFSLIPEGWVIVSGDYDAATDRLNSDATRASLFAALSQLDVSDNCKRLFEKIMLDQSLSYENTLDDYEDEVGYEEAVALLPEGFVQQSNGQLMGSILSFIFLCIINAAAFMAAVRRWGILYEEEFDEIFTKEVVSRKGKISYKATHPEWLTLDDLVSVFGLMINGDDILFKGPRSLVRIWYETVAQCGLVPSIGKNYQSRTFFTVNTMLFLREEESGSIIYNPYVNMSLVFGNDPSLGANYSTDPSLFSLAAQGIQKRFLEDHPTDFQSVLNTYWLSVNRPYLTACCLGRNWFVPKSLGGLGLKSDRIGDNWITPKQGRIAAFLATRADPKQVFDLTLEISVKSLKDSTNLSSQKARNLLTAVTNHIPMVFGGIDPGQILIEAYKVDPFYEEWEFLTKKEQLQRIAILKKHDQKIMKRLTTMCNKAGSLEPMSIVGISEFNRDPPGIPRNIDVTSTLAGTAYQAKLDRQSVTHVVTYED